MSGEQPMSNLTPYIQKEIKSADPITFFGHKDLPTPKKTTQDFYREYNETMDRLIAGLEGNLEGNQEAQAEASAKVAKD